MQITVYADGSANNRTREGGYGFVVLVNGQEIHRGGDFELDTTSNRMEMQACISAIDWVEMNLILHSGSCVRVVSDSRYLVDGVNYWMYGWLRRRFSGVKNKDLWTQINNKTRKNCVQVVWKKGHAKENYWNEICDMIANEYREQLTKSF